MCGWPCCAHVTVCSCVKDEASKCCKLVQCSAERTAKDGMMKDARNDADKLFAHMIEPVTPQKFFK